MKSIIPYTKEIPFESKLAEICSISLEHDMTLNEKEIEGNFIVSGEYKSHVVSVNKETFEFKLPFSVDVTDNIIKDSIEFEITDFTYEIIDESLLKINIEFSVSAEEQPVEEKKELDRDAIYEEVNDLFLELDKEQKEKLEVDITDDAELEKSLKEIVTEPKKEPDEERLDEESTELILDSATSKENEYTTYNIHLVKSGDTLESIIALYQTDLETLKKYNSIDNLNIGDKLIIPTINE